MQKKWKKLQIHQKISPMPHQMSSLQIMKICENMQLKKQSPFFCWITRMSRMREKNVKNENKCRTICWSCVGLFNVWLKPSLKSLISSPNSLTVDWGWFFKKNIFWNCVISPSQVIKTIFPVSVQINKWSSEEFMLNLIVETKI